MSRYTEKVLQLYSEKHDLNVLVLRPTSIYGKFDDFDFETCHALPAMVHRVVERQEPITVFGSGLLKIGFMRMTLLIFVWIMLTDRRF